MFKRIKRAIQAAKLERAFKRLDKITAALMEQNNEILRRAQK